jgi:hypothetical protein
MYSTVQDEVYNYCMPGHAFFASVLFGSADRKHDMQSKQHPNQSKLIRVQYSNCSISSTHWADLPSAAKNLDAPCRLQQG